MNYEIKVYQITFHIPETHLEQVKEALFKEGAGKIGAYEHCAWQILGQGQFRPKKGSQPFIGKENKLEKIMEYKVEMVCADECIQDVVEALKEHHPYEQPSYTVIKLEDW